MKQLRIYKVRDLRQKEKFVIDDIYLNGYARVLGPTISMVYMSLCRHADKEQESFPSEETIGGECGFSERTARRAIKMLKLVNLIEIDRRKRENGIWLNNTYILLDKSLWKKPEDIRVLWLTRGHQKSKPEDTGGRIRKHSRKETHTTGEKILTEDERIKEGDRRVRRMLSGIK